MSNDGGFTWTKLKNITAKQVNNSTGLILNEQI